MIEVNITLIKLSEEHKDDLMIMCKVDELDFSDKAIIKNYEENQFLFYLQMIQILKLVISIL